MRKLLVSIGILTVLATAGPPTRAIEGYTCDCQTGPSHGSCNWVNPGSCPPGVACVDYPGGTSASELADCVGGAWNLPNFNCSVTNDATQIEITPRPAGPFSRTIKWVVPLDGGPHQFDLSAAQTTGAPQSPFNLFANYDNAGEVQLRDGTTTFPELTLLVDTQQTTAVPLLGPARIALLVLGLLGAGVAWIVLRRR